MDLFGTDVPVEGAEAGNFVWQNAPFLEAMQKGEWVLLDVSSFPYCSLFCAGLLTRVQTGNESGVSDCP
jgi:midasin (ATPase involved in ribosome maturation)